MKILTQAKEFLLSIDVKLRAPEIMHKGPGVANHIINYCISREGLKQILGI